MICETVRFFRESKCIIHISVKNFDKTFRTDIWNMGVSKEIFINSKNYLVENRMLCNHWIASIVFTVNPLFLTSLHISILFLLEFGYYSNIIFLVYCINIIYISSLFLYSNIRILFTIFRLCSWFRS